MERLSNNCVVPIVNETLDQSMILKPNPAIIFARLDTLQRIKYIEGPLQEIPESIIKDIETHFLHGGEDDFSMPMWQRSQRSLYRQDGRPAMFFDRRTNANIEVSRFGYDKFAQYSGRQIIVAGLKDLEEPPNTHYVVTFGSGGNANREGPKRLSKIQWIGAKRYNVSTWGVWQPIHLRLREWLSQSTSDIMRAIESRETLVDLPESDLECDNMEETEPSSQCGTEPEQEAEREGQTKTEGDDHEDAEDETTDEDDNGNPSDFSPSYPVNRAAGQLRRPMTRFTDNSLQPRAKRPRLRIIFHDSRAFKTNSGIDTDNRTFHNKDSVPKNQGVSHKGDPATETKEGVKQMDREQKIIMISDSEDEDMAKFKYEGSDAVAPRGRQPLSYIATPEVALPGSEQDQAQIRQNICGSFNVDGVNSPIPSPIIGVEKQAVVKNRSPSHDGSSAKLLPMSPEHITIIFKDSDDQEQDQLPFSECSSAMDLFAYACACEIADKETRLLQVTVQDRGPFRLIRDNENHFTSKVLKALNDVMLEYIQEGQTSCQQISIVVKKYL